MADPENLEQIGWIDLARLQQGAELSQHGALDFTNALAREPELAADGLREIAAQGRSG